MDNPLATAASAVKKFLGFGAPDESGEGAAIVPDPTKLTDVQWLKAKRILEKAENQSEQDKIKYDKYVKQFENGILQTDTKTPADWAKANQVFPYVNVLLSLLYHQNPQIAVMPRLESGASEDAAQLLVERGIVASVDEARKVFAETLQAVLEYSYEECLSHVQNNAALFENLTRGLGWTVSSFDEVRGLDRTDALRRDEIFVDPHARCDVSQAQYIVQICVQPLDEAKRTLMEAGYAGAETLEANYKLASDKGLTGEKAKKNDPAEQKDCYKSYRMWLKEPNGVRVIDYFDGVTKKHLIRTDWPFVLDYDEFPFEDLSFNKQFTQVCDAFPDLQVVESLWRLYEYLIEYFHRHVKRSIAKKIVYDRDVFTEDDIEAMQDPVDMRFVAAQKVEGRDVDKLVQVIDFNSGTDTASALAAAVKQIAESILGLDEIQKGGVGAQKEITATHAEIIDEYGRLRLGRRQKIVDEMLTRQCRHRAQIARQLVTPEKVKMIAGARAAEVWASMSYSPEDLVGEYNITIIAGSSGERAKRAKLQMMQQISELALSINTAKGYEAFDMMALAKDQMRVIGERKPEKYELPPPPPAPPEEKDPAVKLDKGGVEGLNLAIQSRLLLDQEARKVACEAAGVPYTDIGPANPFQPIDAGVSVSVQPENVEVPPNVSVPADSSQNPVATGN